MTTTTAIKILGEDNQTIILRSGHAGMVIVVKEDAYGMCVAENIDPDDLEPEVREQVYKTFFNEVA